METFQYPHVPKKGNKKIFSYMKTLNNVITFIN